MLPAETTMTWSFFPGLESSQSAVALKMAKLHLQERRYELPFITKQPATFVLLYIYIM
jgi:hypothetical protein